jgi:dihydrofolate reductase
MGHHIIMGRKTYETIGRPLPGRKMIVITHRKGYLAPGCQVVYSLTSAIRLARDSGETELFIIGGGEIFAQSIDVAEKIYLTRVNTVLDADVNFPSYVASEWKTIHNEKSTPDGNDEYGTEYKILIRNHPQQG